MYRDSDLSASHPLIETLATLHRQHGVSRIELQGLDDSGVVAYVESAAGHRLDTDGVELAHALYRETDGNPFFVGEVLLQLSETGAIYQDDSGRWAAATSLEELQLPDSVRQVIGARVARLGDAATRVLPLAAVIGREFDLDLLVPVSERTEDELLDLLDGAVAAALVREVEDRPGRYSFAHALVQHTLYQDMSVTRRARAHRRVGEALEAICGERSGARVAELAHHWLNATGPVDLDKAVAYSRQAGAAALAALAPDDAVRYFSQALALAAEEASPDPATVIDLRTDLGVAQLQAGLPEHRATLLEAASEAARHHDRDRLVRAALANNRGSESSPGEIDADRVRTLNEALAVLGTEVSASRARLLANLAVELTYESDPVTRRQVADEAVRLAREIDEPATLLYCLNAWASALRLPETLAERLRTTDEALRLAYALDDPEREFSAHRQRLQVAIESSDRPEIDRSIEAMGSIASRVGQPRLVWSSLVDRALQCLLGGATADAETLVEKAFKVGTTSGQPDALTIYGVQLLNVRIHQGRTGEIVDTLAQALPSVPGLPALRAAIALGLVEAGRLDDAAKLLDDSDLDLPRDELWLSGISIWALVAARLGRLEVAAHLYEVLLPWQGQQPSAGVAVAESVDHSLGELAAALGRSEEAARRFEAAEASARRLQAPYLLARALVERARLDLMAGRPAAGQHRIDEAIELADRYGYPQVRRKVEVLEAGAPG